MGEARQYLNDIQRRYVERYREAIRQYRADNPSCMPEIWVRPNRKAGSDETPDLLCIDIVCGGAERPTSISVSATEVPDGGLMGRIALASGGEVRVFPIEWEVCPLWFRHPDPDWSRLELWRRKWMNPDREPVPDDPDGLSNSVHYLSRPVAEAGGHLFEVDFGSASIDALLELLELLAETGATDIELGRSDGSHLDHALINELEDPGLTPQRLSEAVARMLREFAEIASAELVDPEQIAIHVKGRSDPHWMFITNLFLRLQRVGREARVKEVWRFVRGQREGLIEQGMPDLLQLRPMIKDDRFFAEVADAHRQQQRLAAPAAIAAARFTHKIGQRKRKAMVEILVTLTTKPADRSAGFGLCVACTRDEPLT